MSEVWRDSLTCLKTCCSPRYYTSPCSSQKVKRGMKSKDESVQDNRKFNDGFDVNLKLPKWKATMARARSTLSDLFSSCVSHCFVSWSTSMNASGKSPFQELNFLQTKLCYLYIGWEINIYLFWSVPLLIDFDRNKCLERATSTFGWATGRDQRNLCRVLIYFGQYYLGNSYWWFIKVVDDDSLWRRWKMMKTCPGARCRRSPQGFHKQSTPEHWSFS